MALRPAISIDAFATQVAALVDTAVTQGAHLLILPELATTGLLAGRPAYQQLLAREMGDAFRTTLASLTDAYAAAMRELATTRGLWLLAGSHWRADGAGGYRNTAYLFHPDGGVTRQDKLHLTKPERAIDGTPGDSLVVVDLGPARLGIAICYDVEFPEVVRALALRGAEVLACPSLTYNVRGFHRVRYCCHARAIENQLFVLLAPLVGTLGVPRDAPLAGVGQALAAAPIDNVFGLSDGVLAQGPAEGEAIVVVDLDLDRLRESRQRSEVPTLRHLRPDLYRQLVADDAKPPI
jgi:predicted amidohydrolase